MLPRFLLIADGFSRLDRFEVLVNLVSADIVQWVQLRDHTASEEAFGKSTALLMDRLLAGDVQISVNSRLEAARDFGVGLHVGRRGPSLSKAREVLGPEALLGFSAHNDFEGMAASKAGADYLTYSPVFSTASKPDVEAQGLEKLEKFCAAVEPLPVLALGGIRTERAVECLRAGAYGVAVVSGIMNAHDPVWAARKYLKAIEAAV